MASTVGLALRRAPSPKPVNPGGMYSRFSSPPASPSTPTSSLFTWKRVLALVVVAIILWRAYFPSGADSVSTFLSARLRSVEVEPVPKLAVSSSPSTSNEYLIVGVQGEPEFSQAVAFSWRLKDHNPKFASRALAFLDLERFGEWIKRSRQQYAIPDAFDLETTSTVILKGDKFLGGSASLRSDTHASGFVIPEATQTAPTKVVAEQGTEDNRAQPVIDERPVLNDDTASLPVATSDTLRQSKAVSLAYLPTQVTFKNKIITGYRSGEGKPFTNYKPFATALTGSENWQFMYQAPLMASIILVQDQTSASIAMVRYPKALINNIGWGGQSCLGGTKGTQIQCRSNKAVQDGCTYESLKIQPPQNRLWIAEECRDFFANKCDDQQLFIQKPSGGQHGFGMKVHQGCAALKEEFSPYCDTEYPSTKKKYFIMPYLQPALLEGHKFDLRTYGLLASLDPLLVFYGDGFVRRATTRYSTDNLQDESAHITNSVKQNSKDDHFWDFKRLSDYLQEKHSFPRDFMFKDFRKRALKVTQFVFQAARYAFKKKRGRFQLFAFDWIVDSQGGVHLLEVNSNPLVGSAGYAGLEHQFPQIWKDLMLLVIDIQTGSLMGAKLKKDQFTFGSYWRLCLNELEEEEVYNSCKAFQGDENPRTGLLQGVGSDRHQKSLQDIQHDLDEEIKDDVAISLEDTTERQEADGDLLGEMNSTTTTNKREIPCPSQMIVDENRKRCILAPGSEDETVYHIIASLSKGPVVVVVAGVHGNEGAGVVAARHLAKHWTLSRGTLVVLERANARGVAANQRFVPAAHDVALYDLNRAFSLGDAISSASSGRVLVNAIWALMEEIRPDLFFDLHEGRAFFAASTQAGNDTATVDSILKNVGSTTGGKVSKGNSIVTSLNAEALARVIAGACNENIDDAGRRFLIMAPPIAGGLASKVEASFHAKVMLFETTLVFPLETRAKQHLFMLGTALKAIGMLPQEFEGNTAGGPVEHCVATRMACSIKS